MKTPLPRPGAVLGAYPQRLDAPRPGWLARLGEALPGREALRARALQAATRRTLAQIAALREAPAAARQAALHATRAALAREGLASPAAERCCALVALEIETRHGRRLRPNQLMAALAVLRGLLAEVPTGEGKSLATATAACVAALAGVPVHVVTSNDYLAARDADAMRPLAAAFGLDVGAIAPDMDSAARRAVHACALAFTSARELVFDYLRDTRLPPPDPLAPESAPARVLRGLCLALIDEADSVLLDEAATPFILAEQADGPEQIELCLHALRLAHTMQAGQHFRLDARTRGLELLPAGLALVAQAPVAAAPALWSVPRYRAELVEFALRALHVLRRDVDYLVSDGAIHLIDANSGRRAAGRSWSRGLHQMVELKERCTPSAATRVQAQISFQRFFARYHRVGGMSGTLHEARAELFETYGLRVQRIPTGRPRALHVAGPRVAVNGSTRHAVLLAQVRAEHARGRPVLIGTDSVSESEQVAALLRAAGLRHQVLNARQDAGEAAAIAAAGGRGAITVTTNMAGRGTDILIGAREAAAGGLHVLSCQHNASPRIDRQLFGRAGRLGQPGSAQTLLSLDEGLLGRSLPRSLRRLIRRAAGRDGFIPSSIASALVRLTQRREEHRARRQRRALRESDARQAREQLFGSRPE